MVRLLRHPSACAVINELHIAASAQQRRALAAEFYSRQALLLEQARMQPLSREVWLQLQRTPLSMV